MKVLPFLLFIFMPINSLFGQVQDYFKLISNALSLYEIQEYNQAGMSYEEAFSMIKDKKVIPAIDRYNAACSWALANKFEKAFEQLTIIADLEDFTVLSWADDDSDFENIQKDSSWALFVAKVNKKKEFTESNYNKKLFDRLSAVYDDDQNYRLQLSDIEKKYGFNSPEVKDHWKLIHEKDSINLRCVTEIVDNYGWLGTDVVGVKGNLALFFVLQHADLSTQEKYLPLIKQAVADGNAQPRNLAYFEDRIAMRKGKRQRFGTQVWIDGKTGESFLFPVESPDSLDIRRANVGLNSISEFLEGMNMHWDLEKYKNSLPELEEKFLR